MVYAMTEPLHRAVPDPSTRLAESDANELLLVAGGAVDRSEHGVGSRFTISSAPSLKRSLLELLPAV
jgi:hypothetical protein